MLERRVAAPKAFAPPWGAGPQGLGGNMTFEMWVDLLLAIIGGAVRVGTPFLLVSLGECLTEKSGRINLGLEGVLVLGAMAGLAAPT